jgi:hypothetical protein
VSGLKKRLGSAERPELGHAGRRAAGQLATQFRSFRWLAPPPETGRSCTAHQSRFSVSSNEFRENAIENRFREGGLTEGSEETDPAPAIPLHLRNGNGQVTDIW